MTLPLTGRTVLVLAQHPMALSGIATALERAGAHPIAARTYQEALPLALLENVDAIICEVGGSQTRDGAELIRTLRYLSTCGAHLESVRVIALGGPSSIDSSAKADAILIMRRASAPSGAWRRTSARRRPTDPTARDRVWS